MSAEFSRFVNRYSKFNMNVLKRKNKESESWTSTHRIQHPERGDKFETTRNWNFEFRAILSTWLWKNMLVPPYNKTLSEKILIGS